MKKNALYIALMLLIVHLLSVNSFAFEEVSHDVSSCSTCQEMLTPEQVEKVGIILEQIKPKMKDLRLKLQEKRQALVNLHYNIDTDPEAMVTLGMELQKQRKAIMNELKNINERIQREVGANIRFKMPHGRGCRALQKTSYCPVYMHHSDKN